MTLKVVRGSSKILFIAPANILNKGCILGLVYNPVSIKIFQVLNDFFHYQVLSWTTKKK